MTTSESIPRTSAPRYRTHEIRELSPAQHGADVRVAGFVHAKREFGALIFLELRDESGILQCVADAACAALETLRALPVESVLSVQGTLQRRAESAVNPRLPSGAVELNIVSVETLSTAELLPFSVRDRSEPPEEQRLRHRFVDLRRERLHHNIVLRSRVIARLRELLQARGFLEIQTPILTASSPEGARDFLVPSRLHPGKFYALPQAPQLFKQLLMVGGFERYFQIAPCFRDEAARADRSPGEFYQLDLELAYCDENSIFACIEPVLGKVFAEFGCFRTQGPPFPRMTYQQAITRYGCDKPDLRNTLTLQDVSAMARTTPELLQQGALRALLLPGASNQPRRFFEELRGLAQSHKAELGWLAEGKPSRGYLPHASEMLRTTLTRELNAAPSDVIVLLAAPLESRAAVELLRRAGQVLSVIDTESYRFCWVTDYPMYEPNPETGGFAFSHNPFSMPQGGAAAFERHPLAILAHQYDLVCNGIELSSGALRNYRADWLIRAFGIAGYAPSEVEAKFGGLLRAFRSGAPPHGGLAPGIDRILMLLSNAPNLREVIAFPLNQNAEDLLLGAPSEVSAAQLTELGIRVESD